MERLVIKILHFIRLTDIYKDGRMIVQYRQCMYKDNIEAYHMF